MAAWWDSILVFEKIFWYIAIPFSVILMIQMILTFSGMGGSDADVGGSIPDTSGLDVQMGTNLDMPAHDITNMPDQHPGGFVGEPHFDIFTVRAFIAFFTIFGWAGIAGVRGGLTPIWTILLAVVLGLLAMVIVSALFYFILKLAESGNFSIINAVGHTGKVYLPVKANSGNIGKIQVEFQSALREMQAVTKGNEDLPTGTVVKVTGIIGNQILVIERI